MSEIEGKMEITTEMILEIMSEGPQGPKGDTGETGPRGFAGINGKDGINGYTPVRGVDYWTEADIVEMESYNESLIDEKLAAEYPKKISELENDKGYLTKEEDPTVPDWAKSAEKPVYTASEVGADAFGTAVAKVAVHNTNEDAHKDIRIIITELTERLNALANSDDTTLDQMAEVVSYIKANRGLIESVTTTKVNVSDIIDNLTTNVANKPLSAKQGVILKGLIEAITVPTKTSELTNDSDFAKKSDIPAVPVHSVNGKTGEVALTATDVGAVPTSETLTITGTDTDGNTHTWTVYGG